MNKNYKINEILLAVDTLLNNQHKKNNEITDINEEPLILSKEIKNKKVSNEDIPKDTENIILQAEKYIKK